MNKIQVKVEELNALAPTRLSSFRAQKAAGKENAS
jgi:hypothetical protein